MGDIWRIAAIGPDGGSFSETAETEYGLIVEGGTGIADANSYASLATADAYLSRRRNPAAWAAATIPQREQALRIGTQALDLTYATRWVGIPASTTQALHWPRAHAVDLHGNAIGQTAVPVVVVHAAIEIAVRFLEDPASVMPDRQAGSGAARSSSISIGPITENITFQGAAEVEPVFVVVERLLRSAGLLQATQWMVR